MSAEVEDESPREHADADGQQRRRAVRELGAALRELNEAAVSTEVDSETLLRVADRVRAVTPPLTSASRTRDQLPGVDAAGRGIRMYNPAAGPGNPLAPPMRVEIVDGVAVGSCTLGLLYEGPPSYVHGGVSALLLDQILGHAHAANGRPGMTVKLSMRYRRPVPLQTPLRIAGWLVDNDGLTSSKATIATADAPETVLVEAEGTFVTPSEKQVRHLFGDSMLARYSRRD